MIAADQSQQSPQPPRDEVRGLLAISVGWMVLVTLVAAVILAVNGAGMTRAAWTPGTRNGDDEFRIASVNGIARDLSSDAPYTVHKPVITIAIEVLGTDGVECDVDPTSSSGFELDAKGTWSKQIHLVPGSNTVTCYGLGPTGTFDEVTIRYDTGPEPTPSGTPGSTALAITTVGGYDRRDLPETIVVTSPNIVIRGTAPNPAAVACSSPACRDKVIYATGPTTWSVQVLLFDGLNHLEFHAAEDPTQGEDVVIELQ